MKWTCYSAAIEMGVGYPTMKNRLIAAGFDVDEGREFTTQEIFRAMSQTGDQKAAKYRETIARAKLLEIDIEKAARELVPLSEAVGWVNQKLAPIRAQILAMPATLGPKANPGDPQLGIEACSAWRDGFLRFCNDVPLEDAQQQQDQQNPTRKRIRGVGGKR